MPRIDVKKDLSDEAINRQVLDKISELPKKELILLLQDVLEGMSSYSKYEFFCRLKDTIGVDGILDVTSRVIDIKIPSVLEILESRNYLIKQPNAIRLGLNYLYPQSYSINSLYKLSDWAERSLYWKLLRCRK